MRGRGSYVITFLAWILWELSHIYILYEYNDIYRDIVRGVEHGSATTIDLRRNNSPVLGQDLIIRFFPYYSLSSRELDLWLSR